MRTLLDERVAPVTSAVGFLEHPAVDVANWIREWRARRDGDVRVEKLEGGLVDVLAHLQPLTTAVVPRVLVVAVDSPAWGCAYFDCRLPTPDVANAVAYLARTLPCRGLVIRSVPTTHGVPGVRAGRLGAVQFQMLGPLPAERLNYVRTVSVTATEPGDDGWEFHLEGTEQWFEETERYTRPRVRDRFTSDMLERYCTALDLRVFDERTYTAPAFLIDSGPQLGRTGWAMSIAEAQEYYEIEPGRAARLPG